MTEQLQALVAEATAKSSVLWLSYTDMPQPRAVWHVWLDGAAYVLSGGTEQPLPGIEFESEATVTVRSKDNQARLLSYRARLTHLRHGSSDWHAAAAALLAERLNGHREGALLLWGADSTITRVEPTGDVLERPGEQPTGPFDAKPLPSPATTRGELPTVLHRRQRRAPKL